MKIKVGDVTIRIPDAAASKQTWMDYLENLRKHFPNDKSGEIWLYTWKNNGTWSYTTDPEFNRYFEKKGIKVPGDYASALASVRNIGDSLVGFVGNAIGVSKYVLPAVSVILLGLIVYWLFNVARRGDINDVASLVPAGRAAKMLR